MIDAQDDADEKARWAAYLAKLRESAKSSARDAMVEQVLLAAFARHPTLRRPSVGESCSGKCYNIIWAFLDIPHQTFSFQVSKHADVFWFFRDREKNVVKGGDVPGVDSIPDEAWGILGRFCDTKERA